MSRLYFFVGLPQKLAMLNKQRIPDLIVLVVIGLLLILLQYTGHIGIIADYPFIFLLIAYFAGRAVTWYIITRNHPNDFDSNSDN